jgi:hypothetical protein
MAKAPPIPRDQRPFHGRRPDIMDVAGRHHDANTGPNAGAPGDADVNAHAHGRQANIRQSPAPHRRVLDR